MDWNKRINAAYKKLFDSYEGKIVLADLKKHCPATPTSRTLTGAVDSNATLINVGKYEIFQHIISKLYLAEKDLLKITDDEQKYRKSKGD